jgi:Tfp pilus assembly protein PilF
MAIERLITLDGFLKAFWAQDQMQNDRPFCFILGAGASKPSNIRTGGELALQFLRDIYSEENEHNQPFEIWSTADNLGITDFQLDRAAEFYPYLYERRYGEHPDRGYAFLEKEMEDREPSYGYSVLAWILANTPHKVVITPNFDNLVASALTIYSATFPRVVGHDSLAVFVQAALRRPLIAKVHGDLGFTPRNTPHEIARLSKDWKQALGRVLQSFTPIVIGYGGNDGSLMAALESLPKNVPDSIYWCQRETEPPSPRVLALLEKRKGRLVMIPGFDELMLKLQDRMRKEWEMPDLLEEMTKRQRQREKSYDKQRREIGARLSAPHGARRVTPADIKPAGASGKEVRSMAVAAVRVLAPKEGDKPWWQWIQEADAEEDPNKREGIYLAALKTLPKSAELLGSYAIFLDEIRQDYGQAERYYKRAIDLDPKNANTLNNYAVFLDDIRRDADRAEALYERAVEADTNDPVILGNYAIFLETVRQNPHRAEMAYKRATAADSSDATILGNYADFLDQTRETPDRAEELYEQAIESDPKHATNLGNFARFLESVRQDFKRAELYYKRAIAADKKDATNLGNYALFLEKVRRNFLHAERYYKRAIAADPNDATSLGNYGDFLDKVRKDPAQAERYYKRAIKADSTNATNLGTYANFLQYVRGKPDQAERLYKQAIEADPEDATNLGSYALFLENATKDPKRIEEFYKRSILADPKHAVNLHNYALFLDNVANKAREANRMFLRAVEADPGSATSLGAYALFLEKNGKNVAQAEQYYREAVRADPKDATNLGNYASFLEKIRMRPRRAEQFYKRAIEADPKDATSLGNYAGFLLAGNKTGAGLRILKRAEIALGDEAALSVELPFYRLAHDHAAWPRQIGKLRSLLEQGRRSPGWRFDRNIEQAKKARHPNPLLLRAIADVIGDKKPIESLNGFPEWRILRRAEKPRTSKKLR